MPVFEGNVRDIPADGTGDFLYLASFQHGNLTALNAEDRGIVEFDARSLGGLQSVWLSAAPQFNSIDVPVVLSLYGYRGDGVLSLTDFTLGTRLFSFVHQPGDALMLDVSAYMNFAIASGYEFVGFNLRQETVTSVGISLYQSVVLNVSPVPEPRASWLFALALIAGVAIKRPASQARLSK